MRKGVGLTAASVILMVVLLVGAASACLSQPAVGLKAFSSKVELEGFIQAKWAAAKLREGLAGPRILFQLESMVPLGKGMAESAPPEYSTTNIQVEGVDEADIVKTDGFRIYTASGRTVCIVGAYPAEELQVLSKIEFGGRVLGLFINKDRLVVLEAGRFTHIPVEPPPGRIPLPRPVPGYGVNVKVYDVSVAEKPEHLFTIRVEGSYLNSRMIGGYVYVVSTVPLREPIILPKIWVNGEAWEIPPGKIYYSEGIEFPVSYTIVTAVSLFGEAQVEARAVLTGRATCIYVSPSNMYLAIPKGWRYWWPSGGGATEIYRISLDGLKIACEASGEVPGRILNQFSMDEYKGYFRIATTTGHVARTAEHATAENHVYVLDAETLKVVGRLEGLAPTEKIYAARFMGDRCYLVTFRKVDPLFTIDLSNPEEPRVLGKLKIPGYSDILHPYDEKHLIGIGKEAVPAEEGDFAWYQGLKISLFDVLDVENPKEIDSVVIGDRGTESPVLRDHHALLFSKPRHLLVIPILEAKIFREKYSGEVPPWMRGEYVYQGAYVFHVTPEDGIRLRGRITHLSGDELLKAGHHFNSEYMVKRALYIGDVLYTVSDGMVKANSLADLAEIGSVKLQ